MSKELLSVVVPSYNEEQNIPLVYKEVVNNIDKKRFNYEIIFVNDGSKDGTWNSIVGLLDVDKNVKGINFSRNFGHHAALEAGLNEAGGDIVIMLDADLQHPPELMKELISKYDKGYEIVNTVRLSTDGVGIFKKLSGKFFYSLLNGLSDLNLKEGEADYRLLSRKALNTLNGLPETPKFYRGLVNWIGYKTTEVEYVAPERKYGKSSYTLKKMFELARMGLTSFSMRPLKLIIGFGVFLTCIAALALITMIIVKLFISSAYFSNNAILVMALMLVTGVLATLQGVIALYMVDIHGASKGRPTYIVEEIKTKDEK